MSFAVLISLILGKKITLRERLVMQEAMNTYSIQGLVKMVRHVLIFTVSVTHTADVEVNNESKKLVASPLLDEIGRDSNIAPINIAIKNPSDNIWTPFNLNFFLNPYCIFSLLDRENSLLFLSIMHHYDFIYLY